MTIRTDIITTTAALFDVHPRDLIRDFRFAFLTRARFAMYLALRQRGWTYAKIGQAAGRDRKSVAHGVARAEYMAERDPDFAAKVAELASTLDAKNTFWRPTVADVFKFVCHAASEDAQAVLTARTFDVYSRMLCSLAMCVAREVGLPNRTVGTFFGISGTAARSAALRFEELWGASDTAMDILKRAREEFSQHRVAISDCACDGGEATMRKAA